MKKIYAILITLAMVFSILPQIVFAAAPSVMTLETTDITETTAVLNGKVTANKGTAIKEYGFAYGETGGTLKYKFFSGAIDTNKIFTYKVTGLTQGKRYWAQVIVKNTKGEEGKDSGKNFTTKTVTTIPPTVTPKPPTVTPKPPTVTPKPPTVTPKPPTVTPKPPTVTPKPSDTTKPMINPITSSAGTTIEEENGTTLSTRASDDVGVTKMVLYLNSINIKEVRNSTNIEQAIDKSGFKIGTNFVEVYAYDAAGNENKTSINITVVKKTPPTVAPKPSDTTKPMINPITSSAGTTIEKGKITSLSTRASDDVGVTKIEMILSGTTIKTVLNQDNIAQEVETSALRTGTNTVEVVAYDANGNRNSTSINLTIIDKPPQQLSTPSVSLSASKIKVGEAVTASWNKVMNADYYTVRVWSTNKVYDNVTGTAFQIPAFDMAGTFAISIYARTNNLNFKQSEPGAVNITVENNTPTTAPIITFEKKRAYLNAYKLNVTKTSGASGVIFNTDTIYVLEEKEDTYLIEYSLDIGGFAKAYCPKSSFSFQENDTNQSNRQGKNPSYAEIVNYIAQRCNTIGLPCDIGLAIAWTESHMTHYNSKGSLYISGNDWGIMQVNYPSWKNDYDFNRFHTDWKYNVDCGLDIALGRYNKAISLNEDNIPRATYSGYNTYSNLKRYRTENDARDKNFWNYYNSKPWEQYAKISPSISITPAPTSNEITYSQKQKAYLNVSKLSVTKTTGAYGEIYSSDDIYLLGEKENMYIVEYSLNKGGTAKAYADKRYFSLTPINVADTSNNSTISITRQEILKRAEDMVYYKWTPTKDLNQWKQNGTFYANVQVIGIPYTQSNAMFISNSSKFEEAINKDDFYKPEILKGGVRLYPKYGNDCSGFLSACWGLDRKGTAEFTGELLKNGTVKIIEFSEMMAGDSVIFRKLVKNNDGKLVWSGHAMLFIGMENGSYVFYEQTPPVAKKSYYSLNKLIELKFKAYRLNNLN